MHIQNRALRFNAGGVFIDADLSIPVNAAGVVLFVHGSGCSRYSPRNRFLAAGLRAQGMGTVLMDLLTPAEERADQFSGQLRFNVSLLARRVVGALEEIHEHTSLPLGFFGASTGTAAALVVAAGKFGGISAIVSRGGRPDLAGDALVEVPAPTLLIVGGEDTEAIEINRKAMERMKAEVRLEVVPGASRLFHEPGALEAVSELAAGWFRRIWSVGDRL